MPCECEGDYILNLDLFDLNNRFFVAAFLSVIF